MKPAHCSDKKRLSVFSYILLITCLFFVLPVANAQDYPKCSRAHPGKASRIESVAKNGDARMILSCAGHTLKYAIARYRIQDMYNDANVDADVNGILQEMYQELNRDFSMQLLISGFIEYGYQQFHTDVYNGGGILLGIYRIHNSRGELIIPTFWQKYIEVNLGLRTASAITLYFAHLGIDPGGEYYIGPASKLGPLVATELSKPTADRKDVFTGIYDLKDSVIEDAIKAKRLYGKTYTPTPDKRDASNTGPTRESDTPVDTLAPADKCQALLKQCEARNRELEEKIRQLESKGEENNEDPSSKPIEGGYESIYLKVTADEVEVQVKVNGILVATYNKGATVYLDPFLKKDAVNIISFIFSGVPKYFDNVDLDGKFPGNEKWFDVYNFTPKQGKLEGKFELPFLGKKN